MILLIAGQDISEIQVGVIKGGSLIFEQTIATNPEGYLAAIDDTLKQWNVSLDQLTGIAVVTGPGSFTSSRISVTIANTIAFTKALPLRALDNPQRLALQALMSSLDWSAPWNDETFATPTYDRPPQITTPRTI